MWSKLKENWKLAASSFFALLAGVVVLGLLIDWGSSRATLSALFGSLLGWATGILIAPYPEEERRFASMSKTVFGFAAGLLVANIDRLFALFANENATTSVGKDSVGMDVVLAICCFTLVTIAVFVFRTYWTLE
jgi:hypothetical protein